MDSLDAHTFDFWSREFDSAFAGRHATNTITREHNGEIDDTDRAATG